MKNYLFPNKNSSLVYPSLLNLDVTKIQNILLIDSSTPNYQVFVDSVNSTTFPIVYSVVSKKTELLKLLKRDFSNVSIQRLAICFQGSLGNSKMFLDGTYLFENNEVEPYSENVQFIMDVLKTFRIKNIDFLACNTLKYDKWKSYYDILQKNTGVVVGASNDQTGNINYGGDWVMESTGQDIELIYFLKSIEYYSRLLDPVLIDGIYYDLNPDGTAYVASNNEDSSGNINIPDSVIYNSVNYDVTYIEDFAFYSTGDTNLLGIIIGNNVINIGNYAFLECINLSTLTIGNKVQNIGNDVFLDCSSLTSVTIPDSVINMGPYVFEGCSSLTSVSIGSGITNILSNTFYECSALTSVIIPANVTYIGDLAFYNCSQLENVYFNQTSPSSLPTLGSVPFLKNTANNTAHYQEGIMPPIGSDPASYLKIAGPFANAIGNGPPPPPVVCFKEDTKILCLVDSLETYVPIQNIRKGTMVKTRLHGYIPVDMIGHSKIYNPANQLRSKNRLYKCTSDNYPEITEELIITGCHCILVDKFVSNEQRAKVIDVNGDTYVTDRKYRLPVCVDDRAKPYEIEGIFRIWHLALESNDYYINYGIYANGLHVETTSKRMLKEYSGMKLM